MNEQINTIITGAPRVANAMEDLARRKDALQEAATELNKQLQQGTAAFEKTNAENARTIADLQQAEEDMRTQFEAETELVKTGVENLLERIEQWKIEMIAGFQVQNEGMETVREVIDTGKTETESARDEVKSLIDDFLSSIQSGEEDLRNAIDSAVQAVEGLTGHLENLLGQTTESVGNLGETVEQIGAEAAGKLADLIENTFTTSAEKLIDGIDGIGGDITQSVEDIAQKAREEFLEGIKGKVDDIVQRVTDRIESEVQEVILGEADRCGLDRAIMEPAVNTITQVVDPVTDALNYVVDLAASVGISID